MPLFFCDTMHMECLMSAQQSELAMVKFHSGHDVLGRVSIQSSRLKTAHRHRNCRDYPKKSKLGPLKKTRMLFLKHKME